MQDLDEVDRKLLHVLQADARASFAHLGAAIGVSDKTAARRYARLRDRGIINPVAVVDAERLDGAEWVVRMQCRPGTAQPVAEALARRDDTHWVALLSGGTEISAGLTAWNAAERDELILQRLQRTAPVVSVTAHSILHVFGFSESTGTLAAADRPLVAALRVDARTPYPALAAATGWSESTVSRRIHTLRAAGLLRFDLDVDAAALGCRAEARLWAAVPPSQLAATGAVVAAHPEVAFCAATTGPANLLVSVVCRDNRDLYRYLTERLGALPQIQQLEVAPVIRVVKRAGDHR